MNWNLILCNSFPLILVWSLKLLRKNMKYIWYILFGIWNNMKPIWESQVSGDPYLPLTHVFPEPGKPVGVFPVWTFLELYHAVQLSFEKGVTFSSLPWNVHETWYVVYWVPPTSAAELHNSRTSTRVPGYVDRESAFSPSLTRGGVARNHSHQRQLLFLQFLERQ